MLIHAAEQSFQRGLDSLASGKRKEALVFFSGAIEIERREGGPRPVQARYISYYGLTLGHTNGDLHEAVRCCRTAMKREAYRPEICWNLGRVLLLAERKREAHKVLSRGLRLQPDHEGIRRELQKMGYRRPPVLPFLNRTHSLNVFLGRLRAS